VKARLPTWVSPVWLVIGAIVSVQFGAAIAKSVFGTVDPTAFAWLRMTISALIFYAIARPRFRGRTWSEWRPVLGYGICLATMNWSIYQSFARIPLGLAVTIEFLGPLAVAVLTSRRPRDFLWAGLAAAGVVLLGWSPVPLDPIGVGFALLGGAAWAGYIVLAGPTAKAWSGLTGATVGSMVGPIVFVIPAFLAGGTVLWQPWVLAVGLGVGILSSTIPYALELIARRRIPSGTFSILMSLEPAVAALSALIVLGERLSSIELVAMACVIVASVGATRSMTRQPVTDVP
jgi:inner membrane transporter RhtA